MISIEEFKEQALGFAESTEQAHFDKLSYKVGKKIFATLNEKENRACLKFSETDQDLFCLSNPSIIYPVPNKWGKQGWTLISLAKVSKEMLAGALTAAYCEVAPERLKNLYKAEEEE